MSTNSILKHVKNIADSFSIGSFLGHYLLLQLWADLPKGVCNRKRELILQEL